jgi:GNAT superfamily N-acetyltransferase
VDRIRPLTPDDAVAADPVAGDALGRPSSPFHIDRVRHLAETDPGGAWLAEDDEGPSGIALALVREGVWGLSLLAVAERARGTGLGRELLRRAHAHGAGARGHIVLSSEHPAAMRSYAALGLDLLPVVDAAGIPDLTRAPEAAARVTDGDPALLDALGRGVRGAGHGRDVPVTLRNGGRLLAFEDRAAGVVHPERGLVVLLAARDDEAATALLWGALAALPRGVTAGIDFLDARQQWAIRACLDARLALSPGGATFVGGRLGPMTPYLPSGAWL